MFWVAMGLGAGVSAAVLVSRWARRQAQRMAPPNLARQAGDAFRDVGSLIAEALSEFRQGVAEKESEIRASLRE
jgi:hypothetical protein